jgi:hypothetical protein
MGHPEIDNKTAFALEVLFLVDEEFRPLVVPIIKGTFTIGKRGECTRTEEQIPVNMAGESWGEDAGVSSYKYEPEVAYFKPATDVVLIGHAYAPRAGTTQMDVGMSIGSLRKGAVVFGDRVWFRAAGTITMSRPVPFEKMPLIYERAFGGWDRTHPDPTRHTFEPRNPVGVGFGGSLEEGIPVPNLEHPRALVRAFGERPAPTGFGFVSPNWQPRAALAGTYGEEWTKRRAPLLPSDFDRRHFNAGSTGLVAEGYLRGDESATVVGATAEGSLSFALPGLPPPRVRLSLNCGPDLDVQTNLDTVIIEPDLRRVLLLWRAQAVLRTGPHDVKAINVSPVDFSRRMAD